MTTPGAICKSCHAPIIWAKTDAGRAMPLDAEPNHADGNVILFLGAAHVLPATAARTPEQTRYTSHFATCPDADTHRKPRTPTGTQESLL